MGDEGDMDMGDKGDMDMKIGDIHFYANLVHTGLLCLFYLLLIIYTRLLIQVTKVTKVTRLQRDFG